MRIYFILIFLIQSPLIYSQQFHFRQYSIEEGLPRSGVYSIYEDNKGFLWIGTEGGGVAKFDGINMEVYSKTDGLSSNIFLKRRSAHLSGTKKKMR